MYTRKVLEATNKGLPVVFEQWVDDSIDAGVLCSSTAPTHVAGGVAAASSSSGIRREHCYSVCVCLRARVCVRVYVRVIRLDLTFQYIASLMTVAGSAKGKKSKKAAVADGMSLSTHAVQHPIETASPYICFNV